MLDADAINRTLCRTIQALLAARPTCPCGWTTTDGDDLTAWLTEGEGHADDCALLAAFLDAYAEKLVEVQLAYWEATVGAEA